LLEWGTRHHDSGFTEHHSITSVATIYTIGHSTRRLDELVSALQGHGVKTLADIRSFPMSRRLPHFNRESLEQELPKHGIAYIWMKELGGRRKKIRNESPNTALRNESFRNYADYMMTEEFAAGVKRLLDMAVDPTAPTLSLKEGDEGGAPRNAGFSTRSLEATSLVMTTPESSGGTAIMCAERMYFQCHRMLVSDYLTEHGHVVLHIDDEKRPVREHKLMAEARLVDEKLIYDAQQAF
jgi:uncharacterized protein (DUF488 family)